MTSFLNTGLQQQARRSLIGAVQNATPHIGKLHWTTMARQLYPRTVEEMHAWSAELWCHCGVYSDAISRSVRYFLTDVELSGVNTDDQSTDAKDAFKDTLIDGMNILEVAGLVGDDFIGWGNSFTSIHRPIFRTAQCTRCQFHTSQDALIEEGPSAYSWDLKTHGFVGICPSCKRRTSYITEDSDKPETTGTVIRYPVECIRLKNNPFTNNRFVQLNVSRYKNLARNSLTEWATDMDILADTPMNMLEALSKSENKESVYLTFDQDRIYHMRAPAPADIDIQLNGWGVPLFMSDFELAMQIMMLNKYMEAVSVEQMNPWRVVTPAPTKDSTNPLMNTNMGNWMGEVRRMIAAHKNNPTLITTMGSPLQETQIGGDARNILPIEWYDSLTSRLLSNMGVPEEFKSASVTNTAAPLIGYKIFERHWGFLIGTLTKWLTWVVREEGEAKNWEAAKAELVTASVYQDEGQSMVIRDMAAAGVVSQDASLKTVGLSFRKQQAKMKEEREYLERIARQESQDLGRAQMNTQAITAPAAGEQVMAADQMAAGQMAPGGAPPEGQGPMPMPMAGGPMAALETGPGTGTTINDMEAKAVEMAQEIMTMDATMRKSTLINLKKTNPSLHALASAELENLEQQASTMGVAAARQGQM